jgi:hypothetical protein
MNFIPDQNINQLNRELAYHSWARSVKYQERLRPFMQQAAVGRCAAQRLRARPPPDPNRDTGDICILVDTEG